MVLPNRNNKSQFNLTQKAILTTILYSDLFHFPLTKEELWKFLISDKSINYNIFSKTVTELVNSHLSLRDGYYCLRGKEASIQERKINQSEVAKKINIAHMVAKKLSVLPGILFIGLSGGVAVKSASKDDDIDFFIIVRKGTLFLNRFWISFVLQMMHMRRTRSMIHAKDRICVNLLIDETAMFWSPDKQNIYTAREIAQVVPLYQNGPIYNNFLLENIWVKQYLPNALSTVDEHIISSAKKWGMYEKIMYLPLLEKLLRTLQIIYMKRHRTIETITNHHLAFHPTDYKTQTLRQLKLKMRHLGLLTIFGIFFILAQN